MTTLSEIRGAPPGSPGNTPAENQAEAVAAGSVLAEVLGLEAGAFPPPSEARPRLENKLGRVLLRELESLAGEGDREIFAAELMRVAEREELRGQAVFAFRAYAWLAENAPGETARRAEERREISQGRGGAGARSEDLSRRFAREAGDPVTLLAMAAGGGVYRATRLAAMSRLAGRAGVFGRGAGLRLAAGAAGFAAEAPVFTAVGRLGHGRDLFGEGLKEELLGSYLVLGGLKAMGGMAARAAQGLRRPEWSKWIGVGGMYGGIMLGHGLETAAGLREWRPGGIEWAEGLALLLQFQVSGRILHHAGGERYRAWERELDHRAERLAQWGDITRVAAANDGRYPKIEPAANGPHARALDLELRAAAGAEWMTVGAEALPDRGLRLMAAKGGGDEGDTGGIPLRRDMRRRPPLAPAEPPATRAASPREMHLIIEEVPYVIRPADRERLDDLRTGEFYLAKVAYRPSAPGNPIGSIEFRFTGKAGGPFGGEPLVFPEVDTNARIFREGEEVVFQPSIAPPALAAAGITSSGPGWAYLSDNGGNLFRLRVSEVRERSLAGVPLDYVAELHLQISSGSSGQLTAIVRSLRDTEGYPQNHLLQIDRRQWRMMETNWPWVSGGIEIRRDQVVSLESFETVMAQLRRELDGYTRRLPWGERELTGISRLIAQIEDLGQLARKDVPWLERFYEDYGEHMRLEAATTAPVSEAKQPPWQDVYGADGLRISLRPNARQVTALGAGSENGTTTGVLLGTKSIQEQEEGYYFLRLQYLDGRYYKEIDIQVSRERASSLGLKFVGEKLWAPQNPGLPVEVRVSNGSAPERAWVSVPLPEGGSLRIQADFKKRNFAMALETGLYGALIPQETRQAGGREILPPKAGKYSFRFLFKDADGSDRQSAIALDASQAALLGFEVSPEGVVVPKDTYLLVKVEPTRG